MKKTILTLTLAVLTTVATLAQVSEAKHRKIPVLKPRQQYEATIKTSGGTIVVRLFNETPKHRDNFVKLATEDFYKGVLFHRAIKDFMIQAGDPSSKEASEVATYGNKGPGYTIEPEINDKFFHRKGVLAAAREGDDVNPEMRSCGSQFYIVTGKVMNDSLMRVSRERLRMMKSQTDITPEREQVYRTIGGAPHLDGLYTIFGEVVGGMKTAEKISGMETYKNNRPKKNVYIKKVTVRVVSAKD